MAKKRGLSVDEKRALLMECFLETADVFQLKEVEKMGSKKGIPGQNVKEILQTLLDDDMVHLEKIGSSNYYWSFPSEQSNKLTREHENLKSQLAGLRERLAAAEGKRKEMGRGREGGEGRQRNQDILGALERENKRLKEGLGAYAENDPETVERLKDAAKVAREAANRWLDNVWSVQSWCNKKFEGREDDLAKFFKQAGYKEDMDYI